MELPSDDDELLPAGELDARTVALQATVAEVVSRPCATCSAALCGHDAVLAVVLGCKHSPRCLDCLAAEMQEPAASLAERALQWIVRRDCFRHVWRRASAHEGHGGDERPPCVFAAGGASGPRGATVAAAPTSAAAAVPPAAATYDAGDLGCGDLVLELRTRMRELPAGAVLHVIARDPAAPVDLPAWCGLVGHTLLASDHPHYHVRRKRD